MLTDESGMPYGYYKDKKMANVPSSYLKWCYENDRCTPEVKEYVEDNAELIGIEIGK